MTYCKVHVTEDYATSVGILKAHENYAIPQEVYKNEIYGKVGHTNYGLCGMNDAKEPTTPSLPAILDQDAPSPNSIEEDWS